MTEFLLDTNVPSELTRTAPSARVAEWFREQDDSTLHLSVITIGELRSGCATHPDPQRRIRLPQWLDGFVSPLFGGRIHPVTEAITDRWGIVDGLQRLIGRPLGMADGFIAATALEQRLIPVTRNANISRASA